MCSSDLQLVFPNEEKQQVEGALKDRQLDAEIGVGNHGAGSDAWWRRGSGKGKRASAAPENGQVKTVIIPVSGGDGQAVGETGETQIEGGGFG